MHDYPLLKRTCQNLQRMLEYPAPEIVISNVVAYLVASALAELDPEQVRDWLLTRGLILTNKRELNQWLRQAANGSL